MTLYDTTPHPEGNPATVAELGQVSFAVVEGKSGLTLGGSGTAVDNCVTLELKKYLLTLFCRICAETSKVGVSGGHFAPYAVLM